MAVGFPKLLYEISESHGTGYDTWFSTRQRGKITGHKEKMDEVSRMIRVKVCKKYMCDHIMGQAYSGKLSQGTGSHIKQDGIVLIQEDNGGRCPISHRNTGT